MWMMGWAQEEHEGILFVVPGNLPQLQIPQKQLSGPFSKISGTCNFLLFEVLSLCQTYFGSKKRMFGTFPVQYLPFFAWKSHIFYLFYIIHVFLFSYLYKIMCPFEYLVLVLIYYLKK